MNREPLRYHYAVIRLTKAAEEGTFPQAFAHALGRARAEMEANAEAFLRLVDQGRGTYRYAQRMDRAKARQPRWKRRM